MPSFYVGELLDFRRLSRQRGLNFLHAFWTGCNPALRLDLRNNLGLAGAGRGLSLLAADVSAVEVGRPSLASVVRPLNELSYATVRERCERHAAKSSLAVASHGFAGQTPSSDLNNFAIARRS